MMMMMMMIPNLLFFKHKKEMQVKKRSFQIIQQRKNTLKIDKFKPPTVCTMYIAGKLKF